MKFQPGQSGNPSGRPKKELTMTNILDELGDVKEIATKEGKITRKKALAMIIWEKAIKERDMNAIRYIYDRIDGTPAAFVSVDQKTEYSIIPAKPKDEC